MDDAGVSFEDFTVDFGDVEAVRSGKFDRLQRAGDGGSITTNILHHDGLLYFGSANRNVYCVRPEDGGLVWKFQTDGIIMESNPAIEDGVLYIASFDYNLYAIRISDGSLIWKFRTMGKITASPVIDGGNVLIGSGDQNLYAVDRRTGNLVWKFATYGWVNSIPLIEKDRVYFGSYDRFIYCVDKETGKLLWKLETQGEVFNTTPYGYRDGVIYTPCMDGVIRAIDAGSGNLVWKRKIANYGTAASPVVHGDMLLSHTRDGILYALTLDGKVKWKFSASGEDVIGIPVVYEGRIYIGSFADHHLYCLDLDGNMLWKFRTEDGLYQKTTKIGNRLIFGSWDCNVYCIDMRTRNVIWKFRADGGPVHLPPAHEAFELNFNIPDDEIRGERGKEYDLHFGEEDNTSTYKSKMTYRVSTQYGAKGKYQVDSDEEAF